MVKHFVIGDTCSISNGANSLISEKILYSELLIQYFKNYILDQSNRKNQFKEVITSKNRKSTRKYFLTFGNRLVEHSHIIMLLNFSLAIKIILVSTYVTDPLISFF